MTEQTPSQAEGERQGSGPAHDEAQASDHRDIPRTTPSQAEGAAEGTEEDGDVEHEAEKGDRNDEGEDENKAWEAGWSGP